MEGLAPGAGRDRRAKSWRGAANYWRKRDYPLPRPKPPPEEPPLKPSPEPLPRGAEIRAAVRAEVAWWMEWEKLEVLNENRRGRNTSPAVPGRICRLGRVKRNPTNGLQF